MWKVVMDASLIVSIISPIVISLVISGSLYISKNWIDKRINGKLERIENKVDKIELKLGNVDQRLFALEKEFIELRIRTEKIDNFCQLKKE